MKRVFFHVQHLLGIGHVRRAAVLARTLAAAGFDVLLVSGGGPLTLDLGGARFHQLPPLRARDAGLRELSRLDGAPLDEAFRADRTRQLLGLFRAEAPDVLITEQFPFGRTQLRFELLPLIEAALAQRPRPLIVSSVRDVVRRTMSAQRVREAVALFEPFDLALIHGDPGLIGFDRSFAGWEAVRARTAYTGYVADPGRVDASGEGKGEVIVSAGGGAVGSRFFDVAAKVTHRDDLLPSATWRFLVGTSLDHPILPPGGAIVEPLRDDFTTLLSNAALSISQAGYNTVVETLCFADRAVLVPFHTERETEQIDRAMALAARGVVACVPQDELSPDTLGAAIERALRGPSIRSLPPCDTNGAAATATLLHQRLS
ncbi:MAG TPA: glycosyltransferase [Reyranella sp.]|nr:glycosyltransferase [Reyranella sp.]